MNINFSQIDNMHLEKGSYETQLTTVINEWAKILDNGGLWRVERVIILFCYFNCNSIIYIFVFISFVTFIILILSLSVYHSNIRLYNRL